MEHYETVRRRKDGKLITVSLTISPVRDASGRVLASTVARDITERKRAEEALRLANAYNRSLLEASLDPLVTIGPDGKITDVNAATEAATGRSRAELIGTDFSDYFTEPEKARAGYQQVFREGSVRDYPLELRHRDGRVTSVLYNASVYRDEGGKVIGVFAAARDITEAQAGGRIAAPPQPRTASDQQLQPGPPARHRRAELAPGNLPDRLRGGGLRHGVGWLCRTRRGQERAPGRVDRRRGGISRNRRRHVGRHGAWARSHRNGHPDREKLLHSGLRNGSSSRALAGGRFAAWFSFRHCPAAQGRRRQHLRQSYHSFRTAQRFYVGRDSAA